MDQKCQSFRSFDNLIASNVLFLELKKDEQSKLARDTNKDRVTIYQASMHREKDLNERKLKDAERLADSFFQELGKQMGISIPGVPSEQIFDQNL